MNISQTRETFASGSQRDSDKGKPRMELLPYDLLARVAILYGKGAEEYGDNNWRKGQNQSHVLGSLTRHLNSWIKGETDEDHLSAVIWNALCLMNDETYYPEDETICDVRSWFKDGKPTGKGSASRE